MASCIPETGHGLRGRVKNKPETERGRGDKEREEEREAKRKGESRRITDSGNPRLLSFGSGKKSSERNEDGGKIEGREGTGRKKIEERRAKRGNGNRRRKNTKVENDRLERGCEGWKGAESPNDLRYETLIKIISSASVGCRGAYTTASRECNDLNGNNSVKDGCSRPCKYVGGASMLSPRFSFRADHREEKRTRWWW